MEDMEHQCIFSDTTITTKSGDELRIFTTDLFFDMIACVTIRQKENGVTYMVSSLTKDDLYSVIDCCLDAINAMEVKNG